MYSLRFALPLLAFALFAQSTPVQRDSQAVTLVQRAAVALSPTTPTLNASGQVGIVVTGTYYPLGGPGFAVRAKVLAYDKVRWEFDQPEGTVSTVVKSGAAWRTGPNGTVGLSLGDMMGRQLEALPFFALADWASDANVTLKYVGMESADGLQVHHVSIAYPLRLDPSGVYRLTYQTVTTYDLYVDAASSFPVRLRYKEYPRDIRVGVPVELTFTAYKQLSGFQMPSVITRAMYGHTVGEYHINSIVLNAAIPTSDFEVQ